MLDLIIKNGKVVSDGSVVSVDVGVKNGKIAALGANLNGAETVADARDFYVLPGAVDAHTHLAMPFGGTVTADGYLSGTRAAVCGGTTTVFDYAIQRKGGGIVETVKKRREMCETEACCDYAFHAAITDLGESESLLDEFDAAAAYGITSFKTFMVYKKEGMMIGDGMFVKILKRAKETGILINVHAENPDVIDANIEDFRKSGTMTAYYHYLSRPEFVEEEAVKRAIHFAAAVRAPLYIVHLASVGGVKAAEAAKRDGHSVYAETCPHYLEYTSDVYKRPDGVNFICSPPMKGPKSRDALRKAVADGLIDTVATDHCPFKRSEKEWGKDDFTKTPNGCAGIETMYPYMLSLANAGKISYPRAVELCSTAPARLFGCKDKGGLHIGKDADIVLYDPKKPFTVSAGNMHSDGDHTIWEGLRLKGYPVKTFLRGKLVYDNGEYVGVPGEGKYIKRAKFSCQ
ncbi:dihydropyrimidinase [Clostridia bacterium]|nr:dihydropyrimidinase [Clostridia bacterium]